MIHHDPNESIGLHCNLTNKMFVAAMERMLQGTNVSPVQFKALIQLMSHGPMSQKSLSDILSITSATGVRLFDRMERDGWLTRQPDPEDGRVNILVPTQKAGIIWDELEHLGIELIQNSVVGIDPEELNTTKRVLAKVRKNLELIR